MKNRKPIHRRLENNLMPLGRDLLDVLIGILLLSVFVVLYVTYSPTGLGWGDSNELLYGLKHFQIVHPPGYPTYLLLGGAFISLGGFAAVPAGHWFSGVCSGLGLGVLYLFLRRRGMDRIPSLASVVLLGGSFPIWQFSTKAEVYGLALFFLAGALLLWNQVHRTGKGLDLLCVWTGLSLTHHPTGLVALVLMLDAHRTRGWVAPLRRLVFFALPGLLYFSLLLVGGSFPFNWPQIGHPGALFDHMLGGNFRQFFLLHGFWTPISQSMLVIYAHLVAFPFLVGAFLLGGYLKAKGIESRLILIQAGFLGLLILYDVPDLYDFFVFSYVIGSVFVARSIQWIHDHGGRPAMIVAHVLLFGSLVGAAWWLELPYRKTDQPTPDRYVQQTSDVLEQGMVLCDWNHYTALRFHQLEQEEFSRVQFMVLSHLRPLWNEIMRTHLRQGIPVYSTLKPTDVPREWEVIPRGPIYEIRSRKHENNHPGSPGSPASQSVRVLRENRSRTATLGSDLHFPPGTVSETSTPSM